MMKIVAFPISLHSLLIHSCIWTNKIKQNKEEKKSVRTAIEIKSRNMYIRNMWSVGYSSIVYCAKLELHILSLSCKKYQLEKNKQLINLFLALSNWHFEMQCRSVLKKNVVIWLFSSFFCFLNGSITFRSITQFDQLFSNKLSYAN